jgi:phage-related protein
MRFISENFSFNNISNKEMGVDLVTFDNEFFKEIGLTYSEEISLDGSVSDNPYYSKSDEDTEDIVLNMARVDECGNKKRWDRESLIEVMDWLITDSFSSFVSEDDLDVVYYFKVKKISKKLTVNMEGYLEVTFKPYKNYAYYRVETIGDSVVYVNNVSNVDKSYKPVVMVLNATQDITIKNETKIDSEPFKLIGATSDVVIDFANGNVEDVNGENLFSKCNRKWISLDKGENKISITGGKIVVICEFPIVR